MEVLRMFFEIKLDRLDDDEVYLPVVVGKMRDE